MLITTFVGLFLGVWSLLFLFDHYLRSRNFLQYLKFVDKTGLVISPFQLRIYTGNCFQVSLDNCPWLKLPRTKIFLDAWYFLGVGASVFSSLFMIYLLTATFFSQISYMVRIFSALDAHRSHAGPFTINQSSNLHNSNRLTSSVDAEYADYFSRGRQQSPIGIVPVVPGLNLPWSHAPVLFIILVLAGILHELGHALAAFNERVGVKGFGVFLLGIYPGALTELDVEALRAVSPFKRLKIFCGGIWHNLVIAMVALLGISALPSLLSLGYTVNKGVIVTGVEKLSGLQDIGGLQVGDIVYEINYCKVFNEDSWATCLLKMAKQNTGYCVPKLQSKLVTQMTRQYHMDPRTSELKCCEPNASASHLCFYYKSSFQQPAVVDLNGAGHTGGPHNWTFSYSCLPARYVTDHYACNYSTSCASAQTLCVYPALFNNTKLFRFQLDSPPMPAVADHKRPPVLFIGHPRAVLEHVSVSSYVPRQWLGGRRQPHQQPGGLQSALPSAAPAWLPHAVDLFLRYLFTFSLAFGLLNAVPCYTLDGQFVWSVLIGESRLCGSGHRAPNDDERLKNDRPLAQQPFYANRAFWGVLFYRVLMLYGTFVLIAAVLLGLFSFMITPVFFG